MTELDDLKAKLASADKRLKDKVAELQDEKMLGLLVIEEVIELRRRVNELEDDVR